MLSGGRFRAAVRALRNAIQYNPDNIQAYRDLALSFVHQGELEEALSIYKKLVKTNDSSEIKIQEAGLLLMMERASEAEQKFKTVLITDPHNKSALKGLGDSYFRQLNFKDSLSI